VLTTSKNLKVSVQIVQKQCYCHRSLIFELNN